MRMQVLAATAALLTTIAASPAQAGPEWLPAGFRMSSEHAEGKGRSARRAAESSDSQSQSEGRHSGVGPRPSAWCGWYMRTRHGGGAEMNVAWNWSRYGRATEPQVGAIVVWPHHVGEITGRASNGQWIILSGNDSHRVRERPRSIAGSVTRI